MLRPEDLPRLLQTPVEKIDVEIGCGNGHFMVEYCRMRPSILFIGVEIKKKRCLKAKAKIERQRLANARVFHGPGEMLLGFLPDGSVDRFHLYFPDPWPKARHRRRRFLRWENIELMRQKLKIGGLLFFVSDYFDYFLHTKVLLLLQEGFRLSRQEPSEMAFHSVFARRFAEKDKRVYSISAQKVG